MLRPRERVVLVVGVVAYAAGAMVAVYCLMRYLLRG
jgi:hypothetical protein